MASSKISGSVTNIGSRVTHMDGNTRVEEIFRIEIESSDEQKKAFDKDPIGLIKRLLTQEGHKFKDVTSTETLKGVSHLRSGWFHIVYDKANPGSVCSWHYFYY